MEEFKVGDEVMLREDSEHFGKKYQLPEGVVGEIVGICDVWEHRIEVKWDGVVNSYRDNDLIHAPSEEVLEKVLDFTNSVWDVSEWTPEQKEKWQNKMFELGYTWYSGSTLVDYTGDCSDVQYAVDYNKSILRADCPEDPPTHKYEDLFPEEEPVKLSDQLSEEVREFEASESELPDNVVDDCVIKVPWVFTRVEENRHITASDIQDIRGGWSASHYDNWYTLTEKDVVAGKIKIDAYFVNKIWKLNQKDDTGFLFHNLKTTARFGEKNPIERELKAIYNQTKRAAELYGIELE